MTSQQQIWLRDLNRAHHRKNKLQCQVKKKELREHQNSQRHRLCLRLPWRKGNDLQVTVTSWNISSQPVIHSQRVSYQWLQPQLDKGTAVQVATQVCSLLLEVAQDRIWRTLFETSLLISLWLLWTLQEQPWKCTRRLPRRTATAQWILT